MTIGIILAAGAGSRLGALGAHTSKAMLELGGRPLIGWGIASLRDAGVSRLVVVGHPSDAALDRFVASHAGHIELVRQNERRGIADALRRGLTGVPTDVGCVACACDSLFPSDDIARLLRTGEEHPDDAAVGTIEMGREATQTRSAVRLNGDRVVEIVEKPSLAQTPSGIVALPLYWIPPELRPHLSAAELGRETYVTEALQAFHAAGGTVRAVKVRRRLEVTSAEDAHRVDELLQQRGERWFEAE